MRIEQTCEAFAETAASRASSCAATPLAFLAGAVVAGAFVSIATILSLCVGARLGADLRPLTMGGVFGLGLVLVAFGGGELFNGQALFVSLGLARGRLTWRGAASLVAVTWLGNLAGSALVCVLFRLGGGPQVYGGGGALLAGVIAAKTHSPALALVVRGVVCNFICGAGIWTAGRMKGEAARIVVLGWCVLAYVACGLEHAVADMSFLILGLIAPSPMGAVGVAAATLAWVSAGNIAGAALLGVGYIAHARAEPRADDAPSLAAPSPAVAFHGRPPAPSPALALRRGLEARLASRP